MTPWFGYYAFNVFLGILQVLNLFWTYTILRMAWRLFMNNSVEGEDDRSDRDEDTGSDEHDEKSKDK